MQSWKGFSSSFTGLVLLGLPACLPFFLFPCAHLVLYPTVNFGKPTRISLWFSSHVSNYIWPLNFGHYVIKGLYLPHSSFHIDVNLLKLKLREDWHFTVVSIIQFQIECAETQSLRTRNCLDYTIYNSSPSFSFISIPQFSDYWLILILILVRYPYEISTVFVVTDKMLTNYIFLIK